MYNFVGVAFVADSGLDIFGEKVQSCEGVFLVGWKSRRGWGV